MNPRVHAYDVSPAMTPFAEILSRVPVETWVFFGLFLFSMFFELFYAFRLEEKKRKILKCFCTFFLATGVVFFAPKAFFVYGGLYFGMIGDFFLLFKNKDERCLVLGTVSFMLNHICFCGAYVLLSPAGTKRWFFIPLLLCAVFFVLLFVPLRKVIKKPGLAFGGAFYFVTILLDLACAIVSSVILKTPYSWINILGMLSFVGSDVYLTKTQFIKKDKRQEFYIMLTYLLAEACCAVGFCLILAYLGF